MSAAQPDRSTRPAAAEMASAPVQPALSAIIAAALDAAKQLERSRS